MIAGTASYAHATVILNGVKPGLPILPMAILVGGSHPNDFVGNITFFINSTDGHYHLKGIVRNILPETTTIPSPGIEFYDKATQRDVGGVSSGCCNTKVSPGTMEHFDIDTGYNITMAAKEFQYMYGDIL
ncbi:MAG: hypothetical protein WCF23_08175 [Candidatus Nitrosopolaris sp.]